MGRPKKKRIKLICANPDCRRVFERALWDIRYRRKQGSMNDYCSLECVREARLSRRALRAKKMRRLRNSERLTYREIGERFGISAQRVQQILKGAK